MANRMSEGEILALLDRLLESAQGHTTLQGNHERAMDYFYGRPRGDEQVGLSQVQSLDVADMVESIKAQLLPAFTGDSVCEFEPEDDQDEVPARIESQATNRAMMESSRGYIVIQEAIQDALLLKAGIIKGWIEETDGHRRLRLRAVDPACFGVGATTESVVLDEARFVYEVRTYTRGELLEMGLPREKVELLPATTGNPEDSGRQVARRAKHQNFSVPVVTTWATEEVEVYEIHARLDCDQEGQVELYRFLKGEGVLLLKEPASFIPYGAGCAWLEPHSFWGLSVYDKLKTVQDVKTAVLRQKVDNLMNCNFPRTVVNERVNLDDYLTPRSGGAVRISGAGPVQEAAAALPVQNTGAESQAMLDYFDKVRTERCGAMLDMQQADRQLMGSQIGAANVAQVMGNAELQAAQIARCLGETLIRSTFLLVHRLLRLELDSPLMARVIDQWIPIEPSTWRARDRINLKAGLAPQERTRRAGILQAVLSMQMQLAQMGLDGVLVGAQGFYRAFLDWAAAAGVDAPEKYLIDPQSRESQAAVMQKGQAQQQMAQMQAGLQKAALALEAQKLDAQRTKTQLEQEFNYWKERLHAEIEEAKLLGGATLDLQRIELEGALGSQVRRGSGMAADAGGTGARDA